MAISRAMPQKTVLPIIIKNSIVQSSLIRQMQMKTPLQGLVGKILVNENHSHPALVFTGLKIQTVKNIVDRIIDKGIHIPIAHIVSGFDGVGVVRAESITLRGADTQRLNDGGYPNIASVQEPQAEFDSTLIDKIIAAGADILVAGSGRNAFPVMDNTTPLSLAWAFRNTVLGRNIAQAIIRTNSEFDRAVSIFLQALGLTLADTSQMLV